MDINEEAYAIQEEVVEFRRALHRCPEIFDPSGIIAVVGNGKKETIALRADMDSL